MTPQLRSSCSNLWKSFGLAAVIVLACLTAAQAGDTPDPATVTIPGNFQDELGCPGDWQPDCGVTHLNFDAEDGVWQALFSIPAGSWQYKAALNDSWAENYGANARRNGPNIGLNLSDPSDVKFYYSHQTHWAADNASQVIAVAPGNFQSELGCNGDWDPSCLRSWLQDPDGDGIFTFRTRALPEGNYEGKVAINESWDLNFGAGGQQNGPNIPFSVPADCTEMLFAFDWSTKILTIGPAAAPPQPFAVTIPGNFQSELGCSGDWQPFCAVTHLGFDGEDAVWQGTFSIPAGNWEYKAALNDSWDENYGANAQRNGPNIGLNLSDSSNVKFYYSHQTHWVTDNRGSLIAVAPGNYQSEIGCSGDWDPGCLRSWLQDPDGDGLFSFSTWLPAGDYEVKVAHNESWDVNFGEGGVQNGPNIPFFVPQSCTEISFTYDPVTHILNVGTGSGAPRGNLNEARAHWVAEDLIAWNSGGPGDTFQLHYDPNGDLALDGSGVVGGSRLALSFDPTGLPAWVLQDFPHLAGFHALRLSPGDLALVPDISRGQIAVSVEDGAGSPIDATSMQIPGLLDDLYFFDGALGPVYSGGVPSLHVWAPTARSVSLHVFHDSEGAVPAMVLPMALDPATGVWSITGSSDWDRKFYLFEVEVYAPSTGRVENNLVTDPYSVSLSADSGRSQILDLASTDSKPAGWDALAKPPLNAPEDIVLYELHVRDFSIADASLPAALRGTYRAFSQPGSDGIQHLAGLAEAGLTHVHILPSFDFATVPERRTDQQNPDQGLLAMFPPDSDQQQAIIGAVRDQDGFNWGYDPWHYNVPEGSYATDPSGVTRIREFREMVQGLNQAGLRVVMDVVYNHTTSAQQNDKSVLDKVVPGYYHRLSLSGAIETSSCCPNTASEHRMMEKLMIDSALMWARAYKVDGFRFDLMGHHMKRNMLALRQALDQLTPASDGVDGRRIYVYGEGWNFGEVANGARGENAIQRNMAGTGIGTFSDRLRDGVRGGNPFSDLREQGFINGLAYDSNGYPQGDETGRLRHLSDWIRIGLAGDLADFMLVDSKGNLVRADQVDYFGQQAGYTADPQENIKYVAAHDNETLFDTTQLKAPLSNSMAERVRIQNLGNSIVMLGQGIPFFHAGQDLLRSKSMDRDSFNSGDWFNQIDWTGQATNWGHGLPNAEKNQSNWFLMQPRLADPGLAPGFPDILNSARHFREMLRIRKSSRLFRLQTGSEVKARVNFYNTGPAQIPGLIVMSITDDEGAVDRVVERVVSLFNARNESVVFDVASLAGLNFQLHPVQVGSGDPVVRTSSVDAASGSFNVPARTAAVFIQKRAVAEQIDLLLADLDALQAQGVLNRGQANALRSKLENAQDSLARGNTQAAANQLGAFRNQVRAFASSGILSEQQAQQLDGGAGDAIACLEG